LFFIGIGGEALELKQGPGDDIGEIVDGCNLQHNVIPQDQIFVVGRIPRLCRMKLRSF